MTTLFEKINFNEITLSQNDMICVTIHRNESSIKMQCVLKTNKKKIERMKQAFTDQYFRSSLCKSHLYQNTSVS